MRLAALAAAAVLAPTVADAPPRGPETVTVSVGHERASGFVAADGRVVTVAHVLSGHEPVAVDGRPATVVRLDRRNDLALLHVPGVEGDAPRLGSGDGDSRVLGRPAHVVRRIAARMDGGPPRPALEVRVEVAAGDSGAPIVTDGGRVTGVIFARSRTRAKTAYAVDATAVGSLLR